MSTDTAKSLIGQIVLTDYEWFKMGPRRGKIRPVKLVAVRKDGTAVIQEDGKMDSAVPTRFLFTA